MVEDLSKYGVECIGDHCSILCMWTDDQLGRIVRAGGSIVTTCEPTVDFLPDKKAVFCLPMSSVANVSLEDIGGPGRAVAYFDRIADILKRHNLPFEECGDCVHFTTNRCHGGCLAHRQWGDGIIGATLKTWSVKEDGSKVFRFRENIIIGKYQAINGNEEEILVSDTQSNLTFQASEDLLTLAHLFDGRTTISECIQIMANNIEGIEAEDLQDEVDQFLFTAWMHNLLEEVL
ncbi:MAG: hypothetical protein A2075_25250 [Geobacteraceae bacterium GWC2_58_44]|nr:MAG: hypothetical protein A2075_25250 [Geobacteraceae bacterium GWC2_58_44]